MSNDDPIKLALENVMNALVARASEERRQTESYKNLFEKSEHGITGLLRELEMKMTGLVLDACEVIEERTGKKVSNIAFDTLMSLPLAENKLSKHISDTEGFACSVDKSFYILTKIISENLKE